MADAISGVFDELDPVQFMFPGTAVVLETVGPTDFEDFIGIHRLMLKTQYAAAPKRYANPVIFLEGGTTLRGYVARDGETLTQFAQRLGTEARDMGASRLFFHRRTLVAALHIDSDAAQGLSGAPDILARTTSPETLHDGIIWYAEERAPDGTRQRLSGIFELTNDERLVDSGMVSNQGVDLLKDVLG